MAPQREGRRSSKLGDRLTPEAIHARLDTRCVAQHLELYQEIDSTNLRAVTLARQGAPDGTLVLAEAQTRGKGRLGRRWFAPPGSSLLMSLLLRPNLALPQAPRMTMICSLGIVQGIARTTGLQARVKWPNDIVLGGKKLGGILTELGATGTRLDYVVVGMGLNVNLDLATLPEVMSPPTSLQFEMGQAVSRLELLLAILGGIDRRYQRLLAGWSPHEEWRQHLDTLGRQVSVGTAGEAIEGLAEDVDADGALIVRCGSGERRRVLVGDVTLRGGRVESGQ